MKSFGFKLFATRTTTYCHQLVVKCGRAIFVITEHVPNEDLKQEDWIIFCNRGSHKRDSVFNIALQVSDVKTVTDCVAKSGKKIITPVTAIIEGQDEIIYSIVQSECENVVHTLIEKGNCSHTFLPGFQLVEQSQMMKSVAEFGINQVDHVTLVCNIGQMEGILKWYEKIFGMKRFIISREEDDQKGMIFDIYDVSMRLKALQYWKYPETVLTYPSESLQSGETFMLVVVEPLTESFNHLSRFLKEHEGPGVEHVALHAQKMEKSVTKMIEAGATFRRPPASYYSQIDKLREIEKAGQDVRVLSQLGVLLDSEKDANFMQVESIKKNRFLMQIFSQPLFDQKTFFFEIIQRCGARGFGAGNILALAISIRKQEEKESHQQI